MIQLSNSMLLGMAHRFRQLTGTALVCSLSGEDIFLEKLPPPFYEQARELLREHARHIDAFVAMNNYYADFMSDYLEVGREKVHVIPHGLQLQGHRLRQPNPGQPPIIGYLARICHDKGLHLLVEACQRLADRHDLPPFELHVAGYLGSAEKAYLQQIERRVAKSSLQSRFRYLGELSRDEKLNFLQSITLFSLPTVYRESKGISVLEAMANGVPVVVPAHGCFPELIEKTRAGITFSPDQPDALIESLAQLLTNSKLADQLGAAGHQAVQHDFHADKMADETLALYQQLLAR